MPLDIQDGYTLAFSTRPTVQNPGTGEAVSLPVITGKYRPATFAEVQAYRYKYGRAASGSEQAELIADMICDHLIAWDVTKGKQPTQPIVTRIFEMPDEVVGELLRVVMSWDGAGSDGQAGAEKN